MNKRFLVFQLSILIFSTTALGMDNNDVEDVTSDAYTLCCPRVLSRWCGYVSSKLSHYRDSDLYLAAGSGEIQWVRFLLQAGANIDAQDNSGYTALHYAVQESKLECVQQLIDSGANVNVRGPVGGMTLLCFAAVCNFVDVIDLLVQAGVAVDVRDDRGLTALHYAALSAGPECIWKLIELGVPIDAQSNKGKTAFYLTVINEERERAQQLIGLGANIETRDNTSRTPLHWAAWNNCVVSTRFLVKAGADVRAIDSDGNTPLLSVTENATKIQFGEGCIQLACKKILPVVRLLIQAGADVNALNYCGSAPLDFVSKLNFNFEEPVDHIYPEVIASLKNPDGVIFDAFCERACKEEGMLHVLRKRELGVQNCKPSLGDI